MNEVSELVYKEQKGVTAYIMHTPVCVWFSVNKCVPGIEEKINKENKVNTKTKHGTKNHALPATEHKHATCTTLSYFGTAFFPRSVIESFKHI